MAVYFGVREIPAVILINQAGKVVSLDAHGKKLGKELRKLLGPIPESERDEKAATKSAT